MQPIAKLKSKSIPFSLLLKPRVGTIVNAGGNYYYNSYGKNGPITDANLWFKLFGADVIKPPLEKTAADIIGTDPDFKIDLSTDGLPDFPASLKVYIDVIGDEETPDYQAIDPVIYNASTKILSGMNSPEDFPNQKIKIIFQ